MRQKLHLKKVKSSYQVELNNAISFLLKKYDKRMTPNSIKGYVTDTRRGYAHVEENIFSVPLWAYKRGPDYFVYYIAHEVAHILCWRKYFDSNHDYKFYAIFKEICPKEFQHYELHYKKSSVKYGISL